MRSDLRVSIDVRPLALAEVTGIGLLVSQIMEELAARGVRFVAISDRPVPEGRLAPGTPLHVVQGGGRIRWEETRLKPAIAGLTPAPDVHHATWNHGVPAGLPVPALLSLHDLIPWKHPGLVPWPRPAWLHRGLYRRAVRRSARAAAVITTLSEASRTDIEAFLPEVAPRVRLVPCAVPRWFTAPDPAAIEEARARFGGEYWLYVGGFDPRKDVSVLLRAAARLFGEEPRARVPIVLAGAPNEHAAACRALALDLGLIAHWPGHVPDGWLAGLYAGASLFIYPSRYEGFGIPPLLAMAAGKALIVSDGGAIPELVADTGLLFHAGDEGALLERLRSAVRSPEALRERAARGPERARAFSLEQLAERMMRAYGEAAERREACA